jgi:hypothetical protein
VCTLANFGMQGRCIATLNARCTVLSETCQRRACPFAFWMDLDVWHIFARNYVEPNKPFQVTAAPSSAPILVGRDDASAAFAAIAACAHQTSIIQCQLRGGKQDCLGVFDGIVCTHWRVRHEVGAGTCQGFTNR